MSTNLTLTVRNTRSGDLENVPLYERDSDGKTVVSQASRQVRPADVVGLKVNYDSQSESESALATLRAHASKMNFEGEVPAAGRAYPRSGFFAFVSKRGQAPEAPMEPLADLPF